MAQGSFLAGLLGRGAPSGPAGGLVGGVGEGLRTGWQRCPGQFNEIGDRAYAGSGRGH